MNTKTCALSLSLLAGACALAMPAVSHAANIGTYGSCFGGSKNTAILAAGHTPVALADLSAGSLQGLGGLIIENCNGSALSSVINPDVKASISNGMLLVVDDWNPGATTSAALPGTPAVTWQDDSGSQIDLVGGMPYITGPGGTLTNASLDGGSSSNHGFTSSVVPASITRLLTTNDPTQTVAIAYTYGSGRVVYSAMPLDAYLPGGAIDNSVIAPGVQTYMTNILANSNLVSTTCASEGYIGAKLTWCKNICENNLTGQVLDTWIHRWINRYRVLPYCAAENGPQPL